MNPNVLLLERMKNDCYTLSTSQIHYLFSVRAHKPSSHYMSNLENWVMKYKKMAHI
jgi:hypothetical protein